VRKETVVSSRSLS